MTTAEAGKPEPNCVRQRQEDRRSIRRFHALAWLSSVLAALCLGLIAASILNRPEPPWEPLGPYPRQIVHAPDDAVFETAGRTYPMVDLSENETVEVVGTKCYQEPVTVAGTVSWYSRKPLGLTYLSGSGVAEREKGCITQTFQNEIPEVVQEWARLQFADGRAFVLVAIVGQEVAVRDDRTDSETGTWRSEDLALVP